MKMVAKNYLKLIFIFVVVLSILLLVGRNNQIQISNEKNYSNKEKNCSTSDDCGSDEDCIENICEVIECRKDSDCAEGQWCNYRYKNCLADINKEQCAYIGDNKCKTICRNDSDCLNGSCIGIARGSQDNIIIRGACEYEN